MALLLMILRKMVKNKWLELSLLFGLVASVALVSSMPIYTNAILQRMLIKDLEQLQINTQEYAGFFSAFTYLNGDLTPDQKLKALLNIDDFMNRQRDSFGAPPELYVRERSTENMTFEPADPTQVDATKTRNGDVTSMSDLEQHVRLVDGRLPAKEPVNGVYEALVNENVLSNMKLVLGNEFILKSDYIKEPIHIKPVGVIDAKDYSDVYWHNKLSSYSSTFFVDFDLFEKDFTKGRKLNVVSGFWHYALDYSKMTLNSIRPYLDTYDRIDTYFYNRYTNYSLKAPAVATIQKYLEEEKKLRLLLWSLNVPVMIMLGFYLFMVSNLITERQKTEIAVLRSRGASRWQILLGYVIEGVLLGAVAYAVGPYCGLLLTKMLGASNGFLEFVQRAALNAKLGHEAYEYALIAVASSVVMTLIPAYLATRVSIVGRKQQMARQQRSSFWHKYFLDAAMLAVAIYGLQSFKRRMNDLLSLGLDSIDFKVDPLLFLVPALFVLSMGLILLRVYPWFIRLAYRIGRKWWPPSLYSTMIQVGRSTTQYQFIMVFLIITIATGLFSASAARTMNKNTEDKIRYLAGADITLQIQWENDAPPPNPYGGAGGPGGGEAQDVSKAGEVPVKKKVQFSEPPFQPFAQLPGVEAAAKVFKKENAYITAGKTNTGTMLMGIDTDDFGRVAWMRDRLLDHHFYDYLNVMAEDPTAVLISRSIADQYGVKPGDHVTLAWNGVEGAEFNVYAIIDYWPSWNPNPVLSGSERAADPKAKAKLPNLVVGHLSYIQNNMALEPYDIWLKMKPDASTKQLYDAMAEQNLPITKLVDARQELIQSKNDPFRLAVNGVMTLGFIISMIISFFGFLLYWVLSLSGRTLQFGILRAMGISFKQLIGMLLTEQLLTSGAAIVIGAITGNVTSRLFVPLFQLSFNTASQVPPFLVTFDPRDPARLYAVVTFMMALGLLILGTMLSRIKIHQAVKLGED